MKLKFPFFCLTIFLLIPIHQLFSQIDEVHLKNGSIIRGEIIEKRPDSSIRLQMENRNIFVYSEDEVSTIKFNQKGENEKSGFINITEISYAPGTGYLKVGRDEIVYNQSSVKSIRTVNGYQFNEHFTLGLGIGIDIYTVNYWRSYAMLPLSIDFRVMLSEDRVSPFLNLNTGYSIELDGLAPGFLFNPAIGVSSYISEKTALLFSFGYKLQESKSDFLYEDIYQYGLRSVSDPFSYQFFTFNIGLAF